MESLSKYSNANLKRVGTNTVNSALNSLREKEEEKTENQLTINTHKQIQDATKDVVGKHLEEVHTEHQNKYLDNIRKSVSDEIDTITKNSSNVGISGVTGDKLSVDNNGNRIIDKRDYPEQDLYDPIIDTVNQKTVEALLNDRKKYVTALGEDNYNNLIIELGGDPTPADLKADFEYGKLELEDSLAWREYLRSGLYLDLAKAQKKDKELNDFIEANDYKLDNSSLSGSSQYVPQFLYYLKANAPAVLAGIGTYLGVQGVSGIAGAVIGAGASEGTMAVPGALTSMAVTQPFAVGAGKTAYAVGSAITSYNASYDLVSGSAYKTLLEMGVPDDIARKVSQDTAVKQSLVESAESVIGIGRLFFSTAGKAVAKKILGEAVKSYLLNVATEGTEEFIQEGIQMEDEKRALTQAGLNTDQYTSEYIWNRAIEAFRGGAEIATVFGGAEVGRDVLIDTAGKTRILNNLKNNISQYYDTEIQKQKNSGNNERVQELIKEKAKSTSSEYINELYEVLNTKSGKQYMQEQKDDRTVIDVTYKDEKTNERMLSNIEEELRNSTDKNAKLTIQNEITKTQSNIKNTLESLTNNEYEVVFYKAEGINSEYAVNEFVSSKIGGKKIYINDNMNAKDTVSVAWHGLAHFLAENNSSILNEFKTNLSLEQMDSYRESLPYEVSDSRLVEEMFSDYVGELLSNEKVMNKLEAKNKTVSDRIKQLLRNFINNITGIESDNVSVSKKYNLSNISKLQGNFFANRNLENKIIDMLSGLKTKSNNETEYKSPQQVKTNETKKVTNENNVKSNREDNSKIEENNVKEESELQKKFNKLKEENKPIPVIKRMIAQELGIKNYTSLKINAQVDSTYRRLNEEYEGNRFSNKKDVDINKNRIYNKISTKERNQILSEVMLWRNNEPNGIRFIDLSRYGYASYSYYRNGNDIEILQKYVGDEEFIKAVRSVVLNETNRISNGNNKIVKSIRSRIRNYYTSNANSARQQQSNRGVEKNNGYGKQGRGINSTENVKNNGRNLEENSEKGSLSLPKNTFDVTNIENLNNAHTLYYLTREDGQYFAQAVNGSGKIIYDGVFYDKKQLSRSLGDEIAKKIIDTSNKEELNELHLISNKIQKETDYMMAHRPTETGAYASNIAHGLGEWTNLIPEDVYEHPEYYFDMSKDYSKESYDILRKIKDNPNAEITIYRATTGNKINSGDWVTLSKKYAEYHNNSQFDGKGNIISLKVKASDIQYAGDDINEFGYFPQSEQSSFSLPENINQLSSNGIVMTYVKIPNENTPHFGNTYGQDIEPAGEYMSMDTLKGEYKIKGYEYGIIEFKNPLILEHKDTTSNGWKKDLSEKYGGLTGIELSNAIKKDGYDAIMTRDKDNNFIEIVNLSGKKIDSTKNSEKGSFKFSRKKSVEQLEKENKKLKQQVKDLTESKKEEVKRVRWTVAKDKRAKEVRKNMTENRKTQDFFNKAKYAEGAIIAQAKEEQRIENANQEIADERASKELGKHMRANLKIIQSKKVYNRLDNELKARIDEFSGIYTKANSKRPETLLKELIKSDILKDLRKNPNFNISNRLLEAINDPEKITLASYGSRYDLEYLNSLVDDLFNAITDTVAFRSSTLDLQEVRKDLVEEASNLAIPKIQKDDMRKLKAEQRENKLVGKFINKMVDTRINVKLGVKNAWDELATLHTMLLSLGGGNPNSAFFIFEKNLQTAETRARNAQVELERPLLDLTTESKILKLKRFDKLLTKDLSTKAEWIKVGVTYTDSNGVKRELELPKALIMALEMHRRNADNLKHITGQLVDIRVDDNGSIFLMSVEGGGVLIPDKSTYMAGNFEAAYEKGLTLKLSVEEVNKITSTLTKKDLEFLETIEEIYKVSTNLINETSNKMFGYDLATVNNYFPIKVDPTTSR